MTLEFLKGMLQVGGGVQGPVYAASAHAAARSAEPCCTFICPARPAWLPPQAFKEEQLIHRRYAFEIILQARGWGGAGGEDAAGSTALLLLCSVAGACLCAPSVTGCCSTALLLLAPLRQAQAILKALPSLVDIEVAPGSEITVCGDTHGQ